MPLPAPRSPRPSLLRVLGCSALGLSVLGVASALLAGWRVMSVPLPPSAPELDGVALSPAPALVASAAIPVVVDEAPGVDADEEFEGWRATLEEEARFVDAATVHAQVERIDPSGRALSRAMSQPGCVRGSPLPMLRAGRGYLVSVAARIQLADVEATRELAAMLRGLAALRARCAHDLLPTTVLLTLSDEAHRAAGYAWAQSGLEAEERDGLASALVAVERVPSELPAAIAHEWEPLHAMGLDHTPLGRAHRRLRWLTTLPEGSRALTEATPEERYWAEVATHDALWWSLRLGADEARAWIVADGVLAGLRPQIDRYYATRCRMSHRRARWLRGLRDAARPVPAALAAPPPVDTRTGEPFDLSRRGHDACARRPPRTRQPPLSDLPSLHAPQRTNSSG